MHTNKDWKKKLLILGAISGALIGISTAYLLARTAEESSDGQPLHIQTSDAIRIVLAIIGTIRGIVDLGKHRS